MDPLLGAALAAGIAWSSILAAILLPVPIDAQALRVAGGASLLVLGLIILGVPLPAWSPLAVLSLALLRRAGPRQVRSNPG